MHSWKNEGNDYWGVLEANITVLSESRAKHMEQLHMNNVHGSPSFSIRERCIDRWWRNIRVHVRRDFPLHNYLLLHGNHEMVWCMPAFPGRHVPGLMMVTVQESCIWPLGNLLFQESGVLSHQRVCSIFHHVPSQALAWLLESEITLIFDSVSCICWQCLWSLFFWGTGGKAQGFT